MQAEPRNPAWLNRMVAHPARLWVLALAAMALFVTVIGATLWTVPLRAPYTVHPVALSAEASHAGGNLRVTLPRVRFGRLPRPGARGAIERKGGETASVTVKHVTPGDTVLTIELATDASWRASSGEPARLWLRYPRLIAAFLR